MTISNREITTTRLAQMAPTIWASDTQNAIQFRMVLANDTVVNTKYEAQMRIGRTIRIPLRSNLNTQTKTEGLSNTVNYQAFTEAAQDVTISTYEYAAQLLNEVIETQSAYNERQRIAKDIGYSLARGMEVSIANLFQSFTQIVGTLGADPDDAVIRRANQYLDNAGVTENARWIWGPAAVAALYGIDKFTSRDFVSKPVIETAMLPMLLGYPSLRSNLLRNPATGQTECALFHQEAIILTRQIRPNVKVHYMPQHFADAVAATQLYSADEANWIQETPAGDSPGTAGDFGAVLIRSA